MIEHLLLHLKINQEWERLKSPGFAVIAQQINGYYNMKKFPDNWEGNLARAIKDDFDEYIKILKMGLTYFEISNLIVDLNGKEVKRVVDALRGYDT